jgi:hypothetical protein
MPPTESQVILRIYSLQTIPTYPVDREDFDLFIEEVRTTERNAAFMPWASPPLVRIAILLIGYKAIPVCEAIGLNGVLILATNSVGQGQEFWRSDIIERLRVQYIAWS